MCEGESKMAQKINKDTDIVVTSGCVTSYSYPKYGFNLEALGDEATLTFGELRAIAMSSDKVALHKFYIMPTEILEEEFDMNDLIKQLRMEKPYNEARKVFGLDEDDIITADSFIDFIKESSVDELKEVLKNPNLSGRLSDITVGLYRENEVQVDKLRVVLEHNNIDLGAFISDTID